MKSIVRFCIAMLAVAALPIGSQAEETMNIAALDVGEHVKHLPGPVSFSLESEPMLSVRIDKEEISMLVDTGSAYVVLTREAAQKLGISLRAKDYTMRLADYTGKVRNVAPYIIPSLQIGNIIQKNVEARILYSNTPDSRSLLGRSFLQKLRRVSFEDNGRRIALEE